MTRPLIVGEFGLRDDGLPLAARQRAYAEWFAVRRRRRASPASARGCSATRSRPPDWDEHFTFYAGGDYDATLRDARRAFLLKLL